jgi:Amt family ammonium transporter
MNRLFRPVASAGTLTLASVSAAHAQAAPELSAGDTAWMLTSSALVLLMTLPGLALFYGGLVRAKNVLSALMQCLIAGGMVSVVWVLFGYSLAFGPGNDWIGDLSNLGLSAMRYDSLRGTIPEYVFVVFQGMFAVITPALMLGAFAERMRFSAYFAFITLWLIAVYVPLAHMVWGGGWIGAKLGALDFAGGLVVHMSSGYSALVACLFLGARQGHGREPMPPHSVPLTVIGAGLLWFGWFGFNAGSQLAADGKAGLAFLTTHTASASAMLAWVAIEWLHRGKPTVLGAATAAVAGLVAITPACAFVTPLSSILIGFGVSAVCYAAIVFLKPALGYDDSLDVFGVHGLGGTWGALATGLFVADFALPEGRSWGQQVMAQLTSIGFTAVFSGGISYGILLLLKALMGDLRVHPEDEYTGLDLSQHSETAYTSS